MTSTFFQQLIAAVPRLKTPVQLAGLVFSALAGSLIYRVDPGNTKALAIVGAIGLAVLVIPLAFDGALIKHLPPNQRGPFLLVLVFMLLASFGVLTVVTANAILDPGPGGVRFDSVLDEKKVKIIPRPDGGARIQLTWQMVPLSKVPEEGASVFTGLVSLHDEDSIQGDGIARKTDLGCDKVSSCVGSHYFSELSASPLLVRSGTSGSPLTATVNLKSVPKTLRVWWEFYQLQGPESDHQCGFNNSVAALPDGIPKLAMYKQGQKVGDLCYRSYGQQTLLIDQK